MRAALRSPHRELGSTEAEAIIRGLEEGAINLDEFNGLLDRMYDLCNEARIFVE